MDPLHVEGAKSLVDELGEFAGERRLLDVVFTLEKVNRIDPARRYLLANCGGGYERHRLIMKSRCAKRIRKSTTTENTEKDRRTWDNPFERP
jgi:hypothetical protein